MSERPLFLYEKYRLDEWQSHFDRIYGKKNQARTSSETWYRMLEEIAEVLQAARPPDLGAMEKALPDLFAWLAALADAEDVSLTDAVADRYAYGCPSCGARENCSCIFFPGSARVQRRDEGTQPSLFGPVRGKPLDTWVEVFDRLYGVTNRGSPLMGIISRLVESAGQVAKALREKLPRERLEEGLADVFAWITATYIKYRSILGSTAPSFSELIMKKYTHCAKCQRCPCCCRPIVASILIAQVSGDAFDEAGKLEQVVSRKGITLDYIRDGDGGVPESLGHEALAIIMSRKARRSDALAVVVNNTITVGLQSLVYQSLSGGRPTRVFARAYSERDPDLSRFLNDLGAENGVVEFADPAGLSRQLNDWLKTMELVRNA